MALYDARRGKLGCYGKAGLELIRLDTNWYDIVGTVQTAVEGCEEPGMETFPNDIYIGIM